MVDAKHQIAYRLADLVKDVDKFDRLFGGFFLSAEPNNVREEWLTYLKKKNIVESSLYKSV